MLILSEPLFPVAGNLKLIRPKPAFLPQIRPHPPHGFEFGGAPGVDGAVLPGERADEGFEFLRVMAGFGVDEPVQGAAFGVGEVLAVRFALDLDHRVADGIGGERLQIDGDGGERGHVAGDEIPVGAGRKRLGRARSADGDRLAGLYGLRP